MEKIILSSKIHRCVVTDAHVDYEGSLGIDLDIMDASGMTPYEKILVSNQANSKRFETYAIPAQRGSRSICLNGAAALLGKKGDRLTIMSFVHLEKKELKKHKPKIIVLDDNNRIVRRKNI
ncbi:MAG: aspartate 1-decarboxylase [Verrucomicrobiota bacterium]